MNFKEYVKITEAVDHLEPKIVKFKDFLGGISQDTLKYAKLFRDEIFFNHEKDLELSRNKPKVDKFYEMLNPCCEVFKDAATRLDLDVDSYDLKKDSFFDIDLNLDELDIHKTFAYNLDLKKTKEACVNELIYRKLNLIKTFAKFYKAYYLEDYDVSLTDPDGTKKEILDFKFTFDALKKILRSI